MLSHDPACCNCLLIDYGICLRFQRVGWGRGDFPTENVWEIHPAETNRRCVNDKVNLSGDDNGNSMLMFSFKKRISAQRAWNYSAAAITKKSQQVRLIVRTNLNASHTKILLSKMFRRLSSSSVPLVEKIKNETTPFQDQPQLFSIIKQNTSFSKPLMTREHQLSMEV